MVQLSIADYLLNRLAVIERHRKESGEEWPSAKDDLDGLIEEVFVWARAKINFGNISNRLAARRTLDFESLKAMQAALSGVDFPSQVRLGRNVISPSEVLEDLRRQIHNLESEFENLSEIQVDTKLSFLVAGNARQLVFAAAVCGRKIPELVRLVRDKLTLLEPIQVRVIWSWVQDELDPSSSTPVIDHSGLLAPGWTKFTDVDSVRDKLSRYVVELKPALLAEMASRGQTSFPMKVPDTSQILSWRDATAAERLSEQEGVLVKAIGRIVMLLKVIFARDEADVAMGLGLDPSSRIFKKEQSIFESTQKRAPPFMAMCYELRKFIQVADFQIAKEVSLEAVLHQMKLGLEVVAQDVSSEYATRPELRLQREIARFLIERGIHAVGTKFGRHETDFVVGERADYYVIEVKKFAPSRTITDRTIKGAIVQLQAYMDQPPTHPLGILVVFNFTNSLLLAPPSWIRGRYRIVVINLQGESPSGLTKSLTVEEGSGANTIQVHVIDGGGSERRSDRGRASGTRKRKSAN
jgi:hypothetical protein